MPGILLSVIAFVCIVLPVSGYCRMLTLDYVLDQAEENSLDLAIAGKEIEISRYELKEAQAEHFPRISARFFSEYVIDPFSDLTSASAAQSRNTEQADDRLPVAVVSELYRHSFSVDLRYTLFDFGARSGRYEIAGKKVQTIGYKKKAAIMEVRQRILQLFAEGVRLDNKLHAGSELIRLRKNIFARTRELQVAGLKGELDVNDAAVDLATTIQEQDDLTDDMLALLEELSYHTGEQYDLHDISFSMARGIEGVFPATAKLLLQDMQASDLPDVVRIDVEIATKEKEYSVLQRQRLPRLSLYSSYRMYGTDPQGFDNAFTSMRENNSIIGLLAEWDLFAGFGVVAQGKRLRAEKERLRLQRQRKINEHQQKMKELHAILNRYDNERENRKRLENISGEREIYVQKLAEQKITDTLFTLRERISDVERARDMLLQEIDGWGRVNEVVLLSRSLVK